jgi:hypothetical protein
MNAHAVADTAECRAPVSDTEELGDHTGTAEQPRGIAVFDPAFALGLYWPGIIGAAASSALFPAPPVLGSRHPCGESSNR